MTATRPDPVAPRLYLVELTLEQVETAIRRRFAGFCEHLDPDLDWLTASSSILEDLASGRDRGQP